MKKESYPVGDFELLDLIRHSSDPETISRKLEAIKDLNQPVMDERDTSITYLYEAVGENNLVAVKILLDKGADPNYSNASIIGDCPLWELQYCDLKYDDLTARYQIAKEFFQHGADPNLIPDGEVESLYDYVTFKVFNDDDIVGEEWNYLLDFYNLLVAYGGGGRDYPKPRMTEAIDKNLIDDYSIKFEHCEDNYHIRGYVIGPDGRVIGEL